MFGVVHSRLSSNNSLVHHTIFDHHEAEKLSENVKPIRHDIDLERIFLEKANSLKPSEQDRQILTSFHERVKTCILSYISEGTPFGNAVLVSCHDIGSLKMSTMLQDHNTSDLMCMFSGPISQSQFDSLGQKIIEDLKLHSPSECFSANKSHDLPSIEVSYLAFKVKLWPVADKIVGHDSALHLSKNVLSFNKSAIKHADWFCKNNSNENVAHLVLLLKDLRNRFVGLRPLTPWLICLLAHYCVTRTNDRSSISLHVALRRCIKYLASGLFLSNSVGIMDPCESGNTRAHLIMTLPEQDIVCLTAQYLANVGSILGFQRILELQSDNVEGPERCVISLAGETQT